jgi:tripartite-type tricarboxylate transporter receptor subunit TctC
MGTMRLWLQTGLRVKARLGRAVSTHCAQAQRCAIIKRYLSQRNTTTFRTQPSMQKLLLSALSVAAVFCGAACAQTYPAKPVRIIMGFPAGSTVDVLVRPLAQRLTDALGQSFIVDNRSGATGVIASELVAKAAPDGYTLLGTPSSAITSTPHLSQHLPFDPLRDFVSVSQINQFSYVLITHPSVPARNVAELIALAKAKPGVLTYGSSGIGSAFHLAGELFRLMAKIDITHVPYKGGPPAVTDMMGGRLDLMFYSLAVVRQQIESGRLRALAVSGDHRDALLPAVPTVAESGLRGYEMSGAHIIAAPAATPREVLVKLNAAILKALSSNEMKELWARQGMDIALTSLDQAATRLRYDYDRYGKLIKAAGIKAE